MDRHIYAGQKDQRMILDASEIFFNRLETIVKRISSVRHRDPAYIERTSMVRNPDKSKSKYGHFRGLTLKKKKSQTG